MLNFEVILDRRTLVQILAIFTGLFILFYTGLIYEILFFFTRW
jgi:hypothetical protein